MDQAQLLSIIGSLYDKLVTDVAAKVIAMQPKQEATPTDDTIRLNRITADAFVTHLDNQEWFWAKLNTYIEGCIENNLQSAIENAIEDHTSEYDHDDFVPRGDVEGVVSDEIDNRDLVTEDDVEEKVSNALRNMTFTVSVN